MGTSSRSVSIELFEFIEKRGSVSVDDVAEKFGVPHASAATMLSRWCSRGFLAHERPKKHVGERYKPRPGRYVIGALPWGDHFYGGRGRYEEVFNNRVWDFMERNRQVTAGKLASEFSISVRHATKILTAMGGLRTRRIDGELVYRKL